MDESTYIYKEVFFEEYCPKCKYAEKTGVEEPCCTCLEFPANLYSHKPVRFKEKDNGEQR